MTGRRCADARAAHASHDGRPNEPRISRYVLPRRVTGFRQVSVKNTPMARSAGSANVCAEKRCVISMIRLRTGVLLAAVGVVLAWGGIGEALFGASPQQGTFRLASPGYLTVATYGTGIPAIVVGPGDNLGGLDGALFNAFVRDRGLRLRLYQTTFASMILAVQQHKADVGTYIFYTKERARHLYYTDPFFVSHAVIFTLKSFPYTGPASMNGKSVGTVIGFVWAPYLQRWSPSGATLFPDQVTAGQALLNGQVQGYVNGEVLLHTPPLNDSPNVVAHPLHPGDFDIPASLLANIAYNVVNCDNRGLAGALNQELSAMHSSGEWGRTLRANGLGPDADVQLRAPAQGCGGG
jgi:ABC-type amino acid transport substrate-binding protein